MSDRAISQQETIATAVRCIEAVRDLDENLKELKKDDWSKFGQSYRARARRMTSMIYEMGLLSTIAYLFAKATKDTYDRVVKATTPETGRIDLQSLGGKLQSVDNLAHAVYLYHLLSYISGKLGREGKEKEPLDFIKTLIENPTEVMVAESLLRPFLIELKHLAEAVLEAEE